MTQLFLDAGYVIALELVDDQDHARAASHWESLQTQRREYVTTWFVFGEIVTFLKSHGHHDKAVEVGHDLLDSPSVEMVPVDDGLFQEGWDFLQRHRDKTFSLTDCTSFIVMKRYGLVEALTFDRHFEQAGFRRLP